mmetsp:Transcript_1741/g.3664  ORF Transcript_1741/g.3664 Transcript_1741/m.3664 type:complete len:120 (+) Transcript_1741:222-581(+)
MAEMDTEAMPAQDSPGEPEMSSKARLYSSLGFATSAASVLATLRLNSFRRYPQAPGQWALRIGMVASTSFTATLLVAWLTYPNRNYLYTRSRAIIEKYEEDQRYTAAAKQVDEEMEKEE